jgi:hypothetical protein
MYTVIDYQLARMLVLLWSDGITPSSGHQFLITDN